MGKWPDVPHVFGWLRLDRRGDWLIKGEHIVNSGVKAFIGRNYGADERGRWFFQNGPQRVFVALDYTPFVVRTSGDGPPSLETHINRPIGKLSGAVEWKRIASVDETPEYIFISGKSGNGFAIPSRAFANGSERAEFLRRIAEYRSRGHSATA